MSRETGTAAMPMFDPKTFLGHVGQGKTVAAYDSGTVIMRQGERADAVFYLQAGRAKEVVRSIPGKEVVVGMLSPGLFFGTSALDGGKKRLSSVVAIERCVATKISKTAMKTALQQPVFAQLFMSYLLKHNGQIEEEKVDLLFNNTERRLAQRLVILAHVGIEEGPLPIGPEITQTLLAEMVGTTRPRINFFLNRFRKMGLIKYSGGIIVQPGLLQLLLQPETKT